jgi:hypothetical protein
MLQKLKAYAPWVIIVLILAAWLYSWYKPDGTGEFVQPPVVEIETEVAECVPVIHYVKAKAIKEDIVPESVKTDPGKEVTAVATVPEHKGETTVVAVIDKDTGLTTLDMRQERPSLFALESVKTLGLRCNVTKACNEVTLYGSYEFLRIGALHLEAYGQVDSESQAYVGIGVEYRW